MADGPVLSEDQKTYRADLARSIVERIIHDMGGRKGLGDEWDHIAPGIQQEIRDTWTLTVLEVLNG